MAENFDYDFSRVPDEAIDEFHRQAELWLEGTIKVALAADSRATTSTGILSAATGAMLVLAANLAVAPAPHVSLLWSVIVAAAFLLVGAGFCVTAARPIDFYVSGYEPKLLYPTATNASKIKRLSAASIQERIDANSTSLVASAKKLKRGQFIAALAAPAFVVTLSFLYPFFR